MSRILWRTNSSGNRSSLPGGQRILRRGRACCRGRGSEGRGPAPAAPPSRPRQPEGPGRRNLPQEFRRLQPARSPTAAPIRRVIEVDGRGDPAGLRRQHIVARSPRSRSAGGGRSGSTPPPPAARNRSGVQEPVAPRGCTPVERRRLRTRIHRSTGCRAPCRRAPRRAHVRPCGPRPLRVSARSRDGVRVHRLHRRRYLRGSPAGRCAESAARCPSGAGRSLTSGRLAGMEAVSADLDGSRDRPLSRRQAIPSSSVSFRRACAARPCRRFDHRSRRATRWKRSGSLLRCAASFSHDR